MGPRTNISVYAEAGYHAAHSASAEVSTKVAGPHEEMGTSKMATSPSLPRKVETEVSLETHRAVLAMATNTNERSGYEV